MKTNCELLLIGGSAGSLDVLLSILPELATDLPFAIVIVLHRKNTSNSVLANLLASKTHIPAAIDCLYASAPVWNVRSILGRENLIFSDESNENVLSASIIKW